LFRHTFQRTIDGMRIVRTTLILLLIVSLPVSALGAVAGRMPCERGLSSTSSDRATAIDLERTSPHAHPAHHAQPGPGAPTVDIEIDTAGGAHAGYTTPCPYGADCDMARCAAANQPSAVIDLRHLAPAITATAAPNHGEQLPLSTPPTTLLRPPITV
jgi:hypothetical protein